MIIDYCQEAVLRRLFYCHNKSLSKFLRLLRQDLGELSHVEIIPIEMFHRVLNVERI